MAREERWLNQTGSALLLTLIALLLLSLLGLYMTLEANTGVRISDNYETQAQATYAAIAGLNHARALLRGMDFDDLLKGPDGSYDGSPGFIALAKGFSFRNPITLLAAGSLNISNPSFDLQSDDGLISTGFYAGSNGTALIPATGIGLYSPNPYGPGNILNSRYFVKLTDNNGESSEISNDPGDCPFIDGDGIVIARSVGVSRTFAETAGPSRRLNSVVIMEARFKRVSGFDTESAVAVLGSNVDASFSGPFQIYGDRSVGIGVIDPDPGDSFYPEQIIRTAVAGSGIVTGGGLLEPSIQDITARIASSPGLESLLNAGSLWDFIRNQAPRNADRYFEGDQYWTGSDAPYVGSYKNGEPWNAPDQDPKITVVNGDLHVSGGFSGGGLLIVTGSFFGSGDYSYAGLVLVIGSGRLWTDGSGQGIEGGIVLASLINQNGGIGFGTPSISISGNSRFLWNRNTVRMALGLIPVTRISFREIAGSDP